MTAPTGYQTALRLQPKEEMLLFSWVSPSRPKFSSCLSAAKQFIPVCLRSQYFLHWFQSQRPGRAPHGICRNPKAMICPIPKRFLGHFFVNPQHPDWFRLTAKPIRLAAAKPPCAEACLRTGATSAGSPPAAASSSEPCFTNRPPVFTSRCCKLVSDQFSIRWGNASRRHRLPRLYAITLSHSRTSFDRNRWQLSRVIFMLASPL